MKTTKTIENANKQIAQSYLKTYIIYKYPAGFFAENINIGIVVMILNNREAINMILLYKNQFTSINWASNVSAQYNVT